MTDAETIKALVRSGVNFQLLADLQSTVQVTPEQVVLFCNTLIANGWTPPKTRADVQLMPRFPHVSSLPPVLEGDR